MEILDDRCQSFIKEILPSNSFGPEWSGQWGHTEEKQASESSFSAGHLMNTNLNRSCSFASQISVFVHTNKTILGGRICGKQDFQITQPFLHVLRSRSTSIEHGVILKVGSFHTGKAGRKVLTSVRVESSRDTAHPLDAKFLNAPLLVASESDSQ